MPVAPDAVPESAHLQASLGETAVPEDTALLCRFEQMREGIGPADAGDHELGRREVQAALQEQEEAALKSIVAQGTWTSATGPCSYSGYATEPNRV
eukprot:1463387-Amphidinium_carterae.1